ANDFEALRIDVHAVSGARVLDCGIRAAGGLQAGLEMARVCLAGRGQVALVAGDVDGRHGPTVQVQSDDPVRACLAAQYAGWQVSVDKFFAMGSGPMRARYGKEGLYDHIPGREQSPVAVGVLETRKLPTEEVVAYFGDKLGLAPD